MLLFNTQWTIYTIMTVSWHRADYQEAISITSELHKKKCTLNLNAMSGGKQNQGQGKFILQI